MPTSKNARAFNWDTNVTFVPGGLGVLWVCPSSESTQIVDSKGERALGVELGRGCSSMLIWERNKPIWISGLNSEGWKNAGQRPYRLNYCKRCVLLRTKTGRCKVGQKSNLEVYQVKERLKSRPLTERKGVNVNV